MFARNRTVFISNLLRKNLISRTSTHDVLVEKKSLRVGESFDPGKLIDLSKCSVVKFLNLEKMDLLKQFHVVRKEMLCTYNFVIDEDTARDIATQIITNSDQEKLIIVEGNPGLGLVTINLIKSGVCNILVFDNSELPELCITQLIKTFRGRVTKKSVNMHKTPKEALMYALDFGKLHDVPVTIIGVSSSYYFLRNIVRHLVRHKVQHDEYNVFIVVTNRIWKVLDKGGDHSLFRFHLQCIFHFLYDITKLAEYPAKGFLPLIKDNEYMHLVKISLKPNAFEMIKREEMIDYFVFLKIIGKNLSQYVIPALEKWLPNCGPYLISKGISVTTQVRDLSPQETILLYRFFKECEGYPSFKKCVAHFFTEF